jgi:hypothetical protein
VNCLARARSHDYSACTAAQLKGGLVDVEVTERVVALCAVFEGKAPTVSRLLDTSSKNSCSHWAGGGGCARMKTRAFLIFSLICLRRLRILRFAPAEDPATAVLTKFPSAPVAANSTELGSYLRTGRRITARFPFSLILH